MARNTLQIKGDLELYLRGGGTSLTNIFDLIYPTGSIYMSVNNVNPSTYFGGTWVAWGAGRVPVGFKKGDDNFGTVPQANGTNGWIENQAGAGGSKDAIVVNHDHTFTGTAATITGGAHGHQTYVDQVNNPAGITTKDPVDNLDLNWGKGYLIGGAVQQNSSHEHDYTPKGTISKEGDSGTNKNLQPYITCYMWKRVS